MMNEEEEEMFMRPIQKQEVIKLLKQYNLLDDKNLKPLEQLTDTEYIDIDLAAFYWHLLLNKDTSCSSNKSQFSLTKIEETIQNLSDDSDILDSYDTLGKIHWSELLEPENDDQFEEFENTLMQLDDSLVASTWEKATLKIFEEYAKSVLNGKESQKDVFNECFTESNDSEETTTEGLNYILLENQENNMQRVEDLDKRIKELMEELDDEQKKKNDRTSLNANSKCNDTLEEMEVCMKYGVDYMTRKSIINQSEIKIARSKSEDSIFEKNNSPPVPKYAERCSKTPQMKKKKQKGTPSTPSCSSKFYGNDSEFKIPKSRPPRRPVQSPIGNYIKNNPTTPLIKKVVSTPITGAVKLIENYREVLQENTYNTPKKLPTKTYKPAARNLFVEKENKPKIPKNIQKLYTTPVPQIIKHLGRVPSSDKLPTTTSNSEFENKDLTVLEETQMSGDNSIYCNNETKGEVSLYACKQPLHSNSLQTNCK